MKKIYYIVSLALIAMLTACEDFNSKNFNDLDLEANPQNFVSYKYELTSADYLAIANRIKKPVNDSITLKKAELKNAKNATDSLAIQKVIDNLNNRIKTDSVYIKATYIGTNKFFNNKLKAKDYIPYLLNDKFNYTDAKSVVKLTYDYVDGGDTLSIAAASRFTLIADDYISMGTGVDQPGQFKQFSPVMPIMTYLNQYLKNKCTYAVANDTKVVSYMFYDSNKALKKQYRILTFDGQNWKTTTDQYIFNGKEWLFDPTIYIVQTTSDRTKDADGLPGNMQNMFSIIVHHVWKNEALHKYVSSFKNDEYYFGASAYQGNFSLQYTVREGTPYFDKDLKALATEEEKINFMFDRVNQAIVIYLETAFPTAKPITNDGLDQYYAVTYIAYENYPNVPTLKNKYQSKFQCTEVGKFKFTGRVKL